MVKVISFLRGPITLLGLVHFLNTTGPSLTKVVCAYFVRIMYINIILYIIHILYYNTYFIKICIYMILKTMRNTANHHQHLNMATVMRTITVNHEGWGDHIFR